MKPPLPLIILTKLRTSSIIIFAPYISSSLSNLFNKSLKLGRIPTAWKISNIVPIPKSGPLKEVTNYCPISLLGIVLKVLERCIYNRLIDHVSTHLHHFQFGFLRGKSTSSRLLHVLHEIGELLDKRIQTDIVYLDFAKAFDRVDLQLLLKKLNNFVVGGNLLEWFRSYLKGSSPKSSRKNYLFCLAYPKDQYWDHYCSLSM